MLLINTTRVAFHVPIEKPDGKRDTVTVQPGARLRLASEDRVPLDYKAPQGLLISKNEPLTPAAPAVEEGKTVQSTKGAK